MEIPIQWYFAITLNDWAECWVSTKRFAKPTLDLIRGSIASLAELLRNIPDEVRELYERVNWPGRDKETRLPVRNIVLIYLGHMDQHTADIHVIRYAHKV